jgi:predicted NUDIX family NTP pyrophosphohydrolase
VPDEWVLPKGHVAAGEDPGAGASRKVAEEDGIMARTIGSIPGRVTFATVHDGVPEVVTAIFCLMESRDMLTRAEELRLMSEQAH